MNLTEEIDYDSPLTDEELDYLDRLGVNRVNPSLDLPCEDLPSDEDLLEIAKKDLDIFDTDEVELVNISDLEISGSLENE